MIKQALFDSLQDKTRFEVTAEYLAYLYKITGRVTGPFNEMMEAELHAVIDKRKAN
jgi:hypothetical protein